MHSLPRDAQKLRTHWARAWALLAALVAAAACTSDGAESSQGSAGTEGDPCARSADCAAPLRCIERLCAAALANEGEGEGEGAAATEGEGEGEPRRDYFWDKAEGCELEHPYGFVSMVSGRVKVLDLCSCNRTGNGELEQVLDIERGHQVTHGVGIDARRGDIYYGNQDNNRLERIHIDAGMDSYELISDHPMPGGISQIHYAPNGRNIAIAGALPQMFPFPGSLHGQEFVLLFDTGLERTRRLEMESPGGVFFSPDSKSAFVPNINHGWVGRIGIDSLEIESRVDLASPEGARTGPSPFCDLSSDGRWFAVPGLDSFGLSVLDTQGGLEESWFFPTPGQRPHMAAFTDDDLRIWMVSFAKWPDPTNEAANPLISSWIWVIDVESRQLVERFQWTPAPSFDPFAVWHLQITPDGGHAWLSGSFGSIIGFNLETFEEECSVSLEAGPRPAMTLDY